MKEDKELGVPIFLITLKIQRIEFGLFQLAQKYDFLIVEDDPYYFLQFNKVSDCAHYFTTRRLNCHRRIALQLVLF